MKPTIFFSHSTHDKDQIQPIKEQLEEITGGAIDIFMSSDGASIPFGRNWVKKIEDALGECKIMFVWVTPNSSSSQWVYFESGFVYSRGVRVVPIGFNGVRLEDLPAPLSLLQGFNVSSADGLNNIIGVINGEFDMHFPMAFDDQFYAGHAAPKTGAMGEILDYVAHLKCWIAGKWELKDGTTVSPRTGWLQEFAERLSEREQPFTLNGNELLGLGYKVYTREGRNHLSGEVYVDPIFLDEALPLLFLAVETAYGRQMPEIPMGVYARPEYELPEDDFLVPARLINTEATPDETEPNAVFRFRNIRFRVLVDQRNSREEEQRRLFVYVASGTTDGVPLLALMKLLVRQGVYRI